MITLLLLCSYCCKLSYFSTYLQINQCHNVVICCSIMFVMFALPPVWAQNIAMSLSVCLTTHIFQRPHSQTSQNFLYMSIVAMARPYGAWLIGGMFKVTHQGAERGAKCDVYNCLVYIAQCCRHFYNVSPFRQIDIIGALMIVWRVRGKIIRSVLCSIRHTHEQT